MRNKLAQETWKSEYRRFRKEMTHGWPNTAIQIIDYARRYTREAALERALEASQRDNTAQLKALEANEELIEKLFQRVEELERELQERDEREKLLDKVEWG